MDEDDLAGFDEAYSFDDFGEGEAFGKGDMAPTTTVSMDSGDEGENIGDFSTLSRASYDAMRGATITNPFPESFFSKLFGAENVDYTNILGGGQAGLNRINEINDVRCRQAIGLPSLITGQPYQAGDFYIGQPTAMGEVKPIPSTIRNILNAFPAGGILNAIIPQKGLPEGSKQYQDLMAEEVKSANDPTIFDSVKDFVKEKTGFGPKDSGASLAASPTGDGQMRVPDTRTFDMFGNVLKGGQQDFPFSLTPLQEENYMKAIQRDADRKLLSGQQGLGTINQEVTNNALNMTPNVQLADASAFNFLKGITDKAKPQINQFLQDNVNKNLEFESDYRQDPFNPSEMMPYIGLKYGFTV